MNKPEDIIAKYGFYSAPVHGTSMYPLLIDHKDSVYITFPTKLKNMMLFSLGETQTNLYYTGFSKLKAVKLLCVGTMNFRKRLLTKAKLSAK